MQYHAILCNTMQYHASLITADGAYHCPVGSTWPFFHLVGKLWSVRMSLFSRREPKVMNKASFGRRWIWIFLSLFSFTGWSHQTIYIYEYMNDGGQLKPEHCLVEILPEILGHKAERTEKGPAKCVEICIPVVRVITKTLKWSGIIQALSTTIARKKRQTKMKWKIPQGRHSVPDRDQPRWNCHRADSSSSPPSDTSSCGCCWTAPTLGAPPPKTRGPVRSNTWNS